MIQFLLFIAYISLAIVVYIYLGYPIVLWILATTFPARQIKKGNIRPKVSLIISCYNEEEVLSEKLRNSLSLDYPRDLLEIIVVSDGSSDRTDEFALAYKSEGVKLIRQEGRLGKTMGLNLAVPQAQGDIIVFSDANAIYETNALIRLVENFADQTVGYVVGEAQYVDSGCTAASSNEDTYWQYEIFIKKLESRIHSMVGGDGAIYAVRKKLYEQLKSTDINDFVNPLQIIAKGYRGIYEPTAVCREEAAGTFNKEFKRKIRIVNRAFTGLLRVSRVMNPFDSGIFSFEIISHKLLRWFAPFFLTIFALSSLTLSFYDFKIFQFFTTLNIMGVLLGLFGFLVADKGKDWPRVLFLPYYFVAVNFASMIGIIKSLRGDVQVTWDTVRTVTTQKKLHNKTIYYLFYLSLSLLIFLLVFVGSTYGKIYTFEVFFWSLTLLIFYVYFGYPAVIFFWSRLTRRAVIQKAASPTVTMLICAFNEEYVIEEKVMNSLSIDYPNEKLQIVIASDGSWDRTAEIVKKYVNDKLILINYKERRGKMGTLLESVPKINSEILIFSDANTMYSPDAISKIVCNFSDPTVGAVSGDVILQNAGTSLGASESIYYSYERWIQKKETQIGSIIGADGGMYAIRRELFVPPSANIILDDFVISMNVALQGYRVVYDHRAKGYEINNICHKDEYLRKSRVIAGGIQSVKQGEGVPPFEEPGLLICYLSHKFLRWIAPIFLVLLFFVNIYLVSNANKSLYMFMFTGQMVFCILAIFGFWNRNAKSNKLLAIPFYFFLENAAALYGIYKGLLNIQSVKWITYGRIKIKS